jgi:2-polyprenyl-6-methoxyphenol hydroxylase-like FAD-dependent oxidoreductase
MRILVVGGGIGGLTAAVSHTRAGHSVDLVEIQPRWDVYGVGILQQSNVIRAMASIGLLQEFLSIGYGYDMVRMHDAEGTLLAEIPQQRLSGVDAPAQLSVSRRALHELLLATAERGGARVQLGQTIDAIHQQSAEVQVRFSNGDVGNYDLLIGADGLNSAVRAMVFDASIKPQYTGQTTWRYPLPRTPECDCLMTMARPFGAAGLCPLSDQQMYMYLTTPEPGNPLMPRERLAELMRTRLEGFGGFIGALREKIVDAHEVVYRPLEVVWVPPPWHRGRVVLLGDAVHGTTPHLGQGGGMAIEDAIVLAEEVSVAGTIAANLDRYSARRAERCRFIWETSMRICNAERDGLEHFGRMELIRKMVEVTAQPI